MDVDPGFRTNNVLTFNCWLVGGKYRQTAAQSEFVENSIERIGQIPGIESVAAITQVPLSQGGRTTVKFQPVDRVMHLADSPWAAYRAISPGYFSTMGISLIAGRPFNETDNDGAPRVILVNQRLATLIWPGQDAVGKQLHWSESQYDVGPLTVVGVAADVRARELEQEDEPAVYIPYPQRTLPFLRWVAIAVRTKADPMPMWPEIRKQVLALDADRAIYNVKTTQMLVDESVAERRFNAFLLGTFAGLALLLSATGIYGLISYSVSHRGREFGIRMALGAHSRDVTRLVLHQGLRLALTGVVIGATMALFTTSLLRRFLFGLGPHDPTTFIAAPCLIAAIALVACYIPARRATKLNPITVIREE
jgi:putative ABC transport system permease protein